jgi:hypothetical protein
VITDTKELAPVDDDYLRAHEIVPSDQKSTKVTSTSSCLDDAKLKETIAAAVAAALQAQQQQQQQQQQ